MAKQPPWINIPKYQQQQPNFIVDLTLTQGLSRHLQEITSQMRTYVRQHPSDKLTFDVNYQNCSLNSIDSKKLSKTPDAFGGKLYPPKMLTQAEITKYSSSLYDYQIAPISTQNGVARITISTKTFYPYYRGQLKAKGSLQQGYYIFINKQLQLVPGLTYPNSLPKGCQLNHMLGILISQQIRFNTLQIVNRNFRFAEWKSAQDLYRILFNTFKSEIYNCWKIPWKDNKKEILLTGPQIAIPQAIVIKLIQPPSDEVPKKFFHYKLASHLQGGPQPIPIPKAPDAPQQKIDLNMKELSKNLLTQHITWMRKYVSNPNSGKLTFQAIFPTTDLDIVVSSTGANPVQLFSKLDAQKNKGSLPSNKRAALKDITGVANLTISTINMYPYYIGYCKVNDNLEECYEIFINGTPYTACKVSYPNNFENKLGDMLAILIAEQIRFNTLEVFNGAFEYPETLDARGLFETLFKNFKVPVYNDWKTAWPNNNKVVTLTYGNYSPQKRQATVKKLILPPLPN